MSDTAAKRIPLPLGLFGTDDGAGNWSITRSDGSALSVADVRALAALLSAPSHDRFVEGLRKGQEVASRVGRDGMGDYVANQIGAEIRTTLAASGAP